jgi:hypothetical protein
LLSSQDSTTPTQQSITQQSSSTQQSSFTQQSSSTQESTNDPIDRNMIIPQNRSHTPQQSQHSTPIIDQNQREINQSRHSTPFGPEQSQHSTPIIGFNQSRHSTPIIDQNQREINQSQHSTPIIETDIARVPPGNVEKMLEKQSKQMRVLYELQKVILEKVGVLQTQLKKLTDTKNNELSSKVFSVSNNLY